jgi:hypothetical protein
MVVALVLALILAPRLAHADCAAGPSYLLTAMGNTVAVCERGVTVARCTPSTPFLRQDEATGQVVSIAATCSGGCFNDECVPPGTYRYGLASPFSCSEVGCGQTIPYFVEVTVAAPLSGCTRDPASPVPTTTTITPPWGTGTSIVASTTCPDGCAGGVGGGSCRVVGSDRDEVLAVDFLVAAIGLTVVTARRRRARNRK